ncbi:MAG: ERAP1-like C-terminal domain-containing protein, partial [Stackebrandtia sp.]
DVTGDLTEVSQLVGVDAADLLLLNDDAVTYAKIRLDGPGFAALPEALLSMDDSVARALLWTMLIDMVQEAELSVSDYLELLGRTLVAEKRTAALQRQLEFAGGAVDCFVSPSERPAALQKLAEIARAVRQRAEPGSGTQLAALRAEISSVAGRAGVDWLRQLLLGEQTIAGRALDSDLRWRLLLRLTVLGEVGDRDIDAELERDPSSEGYKHAATCRAALPTAEAKDAAWESVLSDRDLSNHLVRAIAEGFWWPEQERLTEGFVERFFAEATGKLCDRAPWEQMQLGQGLFPRYAVDDATIARAEAAARDGSLHAILRRVLVDKGSDLRLARRARYGRLGSGRGSQ